jgi:hypothetical protein
VALASLVAVAAVGCKGEEAFYARNADAFSGLGGGPVAGSTGKGGAGMAGQGGGAGTGGAGGAGNKAGAGGKAGGGGAGQGGGLGGAGGQPSGNFGDSCQSNSDCKQNSCKSKFCCMVDCPTCQTCDSTGTACVDVVSQQDPRGDCTMTAKSTCGVSGMGCNGNGACILWPAGESCSSASMCSGTPADSVIKGSICDGQGHCNTNAPVSCNGFLCQSTDCLKSCTDGTACVTGGFCGAGACVGATPNLAGNGDAEYGTTDGWSAILNTGVSATNLAAPHGGTYSIEATGRTAVFQGPGYYIPTGLGPYTISFWAMQNDYAADDPNATVPAPPIGLLQLKLICAAGTYYDGFVQVSMPQGVWVNFSTTIDTSDYHMYSTGSDCFANGLNGSVDGAVKSAVVLLNESSNDKRFPNFYIDDLVVTATAVPNLVGNPNFEAGIVDGWAVANNGTPTATLSVSTAQFNAGKKSLWLQKRPLWNTAIRYPLSIGAANYAVTFYVMQMGATSHALELWAAYSCLGDPANSVRTKSITTTSMLATGKWAALSSSAVAFPPRDAAANCKQMTGAEFWVTQADQGTCGTGTGQIECPDLFLDDATIALTTTPPTD